MDTLAIWGFAADAEVVSIDLGTVFARSSADFRFRVRNLSLSYLAKDVVVGSRDTTSGAQSYQFLVSADGRAFTGALNIGDLGPGSVSAGLYLRRVTPAAATTGTQTCYLDAAADSWTAST